MILGTGPSHLLIELTYIIAIKKSNTYIYSIVNHIVRDLYLHIEVTNVLQREANIVNAITDPALNKHVLQDILIYTSSTLHHYIEHKIICDKTWVLLFCLCSYMIHNCLLLFITHKESNK